MGKTMIEVPSALPFVTIERDFDAPRELVFRAYTEPELLAQWLGPRRFEMIIERYELRAGGSWRYVNRDDQGNEYGFHGVFHSEPNMDNFVQTFEFEGAPGHVSLDRLSLVDLGDGRTRVRTDSVFQSLEDRDAMIQGGMAEGVSEGFDRLDEVLARLQAPAAAGTR